jgi:hypothetical protein
MRRSPCAWLRLALWLVLVLLLAACRPSGVVRSPTPTPVPSCVIHVPTLTPAPSSVAADAAAEDAYLSNLAAAGTFRGVRIDGFLTFNGFYSASSVDVIVTIEGQIAAAFLQWLLLGQQRGCDRLEQSRFVAGPLDQHQTRVDGPGRVGIGPASSDWQLSSQ